MSRNNKFCQNIIKARKKREWTQERAATKLGITRGQLGSYEEGRAKPRMEVLNRMCIIYCFPDLNALCSADNTIEEDFFSKLTVIQQRYLQTDSKIKKAVDILLEIE